MPVISILNQNNQALNVQGIRYFKFEDKRYFVFSLNEIDAQGYVKVYVSKVLGLNGTLAAYDIIDSTEWAKVKEIVKGIIKANREGSVLSVVDLDMNQLNNIKVNGEQVFKLLTNLTELLGANIRVVEDDSVSVGSDVTMNSSLQQFGVNFVPPVMEAPAIPTTNQEAEVPTPSMESSFEQSESVPTPVVITPMEEVVPVNTMEAVEANVNVEATSSDVTDQSVNHGESYKDLYLEQLHKNEQLLEEITRYKTQLDSIKAILG